MNPDDFDGRLDGPGGLDGLATPDAEWLAGHVAARRTARARRRTIGALGVTAVVALGVGGLVATRGDDAGFAVTNPSEPPAALTSTVPATTVPATTVAATTVAATAAPATVVPMSTATTVPATGPATVPPPTVSLTTPPATTMPPEPTAPPTPAQEAEEPSTTVPETAPTPSPTPVPTDSVVATGYLYQVALRPDGVPVLLYQSLDYRPSLHICNDRACSTGITVALPGTPDGMLLALRPDGTPVVATRHHNEGLGFVECSDPLCTTTNQSHLADGYADASMEFDEPQQLLPRPDGSFLLSVRRGDGLGSKQLFAECNHGCGGFVELPGIDDVTNGVRLRVQANGNPIVAVQLPDGSSESWVCADSLCQLAPQRSALPPGWNSAPFPIDEMAELADGSAVGVFFDFTDVVSYSCTHVTCGDASRTTLFPLPPYSGVSRAVVWNGIAVAVYWDSTGTLNLMRCADARCTAVAGTAPITPVDNYIMSTFRLDLTSDGLVVLVYEHPNDHTLHVYTAPVT